MKRDMTGTSRDTSENMFDGDTLYQQRARVALPILVRCAKARKTITYKELGAAVGMTDLRSIGRVWEYRSNPCGFARILAGRCYTASHKSCHSGR